MSSVHKYLSIPEEVTAIQWGGNNESDIAEFLGRETYSINRDTNTLGILTADGYRRVYRGSYLVRRANGHLEVLDPLEVIGRYRLIPDQNVTPGDRPVVSSTNDRSSRKEIADVIYFIGDLFREWGIYTHDSTDRGFINRIHFEFQELVDKLEGGGKE